MSTLHRVTDHVWVPGARGFGLCVLSTSGGALFGFVAALGMGAGLMADFGALFGAAVGLLLSPVLIWAVWHERAVRAVAFIFPPTAIAALAGGWLTPRNGAPFLSMGLAVAVYVLASAEFGVRSRGRRARAERIRRNECTSCGYPLRGLPAGTACPECGTERA